MPITDPFLSNTFCVQRLVEDYKKHGSLIVAYDFDNTVFDFHNRGYAFPNLIGLLKRASSMGCYMMCFTANKDEKFVTEHLNSVGVVCDGINKGPVDGMNDAKPYYNILLDDRAGLYAAYNILHEALNIIQQTKP